MCQGTNHVPRVAEVTRAGVADIGGCDGGICVNQDSLISLIQGEIEKIMPLRDFTGKIAARVSIRVELLGDQDPAVFEKLIAKETEKETKNETHENSTDL